MNYARTLATLALVGCQSWEVQKIETKGVLDGGFGEKITRFYGNSDMKVLNYGLKKEFLDRYDIGKLLRKNRLKVDLIVEDLLKF